MVSTAPIGTKYGLEVPAYTHVLRCWPEVDKVSPCESACPLHMDIPNYIMAIAQGRADKALSIIRETNPLPSVCGRVCHHPCEQDCNRKVVDSAIAVEYLKRYAADSGDNERPQPAARTKTEKVAIVGSGPAGLTAAHDLVKKGYQTVVFEAAPVAGGMLAMGIPDFILSPGAVSKDVEYLKALGVKIHTNVRVGKDITLADLKEQGYKAILLATGSWKSIELKLPGANLKGVTTALVFLKQAKLGEKPVVKGKVVVIGGGAVAMDCGRTAARLGASEVHVACLEAREVMPAFAWEIKAAEGEGVKVHPSLAPQEFVAKNGTKVSSVRFKRVASTKLDSEGRISWTLIEGPGSDFSLDADMVIVAVGQATDVTDLNGAKLGLNKRGCIVVNPTTMETNVKGVFAAGDAAAMGGTVSDAMAAGRAAAEAIERYLKGEPAVAGKGKMETVTIKPEQVPPFFTRKDRWEIPSLVGKEALRTFQEAHLGYTGWQAEEEAKRCLNCRMCGNCIFERDQICYDTASRLL